MKQIEFETEYFDIQDKWGDVMTATISPNNKFLAIGSMCYRSPSNNDAYHFHRSYYVRYQGQYIDKADFCKQKQEILDQYETIRLIDLLSGNIIFTHFLQQAQYVQYTDTIMIQRFSNDSQILYILEFNNIIIVQINKNFKKTQMMINYQILNMVNLKQEIDIFQTTNTLVFKNRKKIIRIYQLKQEIQNNSLDCDARNNLIMIYKNKFRYILNIYNFETIVLDEVQFMIVKSQFFNSKILTLGTFKAQLILSEIDYINRCLRNLKLLNGVSSFSFFQLNFYRKDVIAFICSEQLILMNFDLTVIQTIKINKIQIQFHESRIMNSSNRILFRDFYKKVLRILSIKD